MGWLFDRERRPATTDYDYALVKSGEVADGSTTTVFRNRYQCGVRRAVVVMGALMALGASFYAGTQVSSSRGVSGMIEFNDMSRTFHYDPDFGGAPSSVTDQAWDSLFPDQGGFFRHPQLASRRSAFAVFHQLHCLDGIRKAYWTMHDAAVNGTGGPDIVDQLPLHISPLHVRHCVDLLRQALMCRPDLTIEVKDEKLGGVTGFGTEHQCVNWGELVGWVGDWEKWGASADDVRPDKHSHDHGHDHEHGQDHSHV